MRKNLRTQKKLIYSVFNVRICLILIVIAGCFQFSYAQTLHYPLSKHSRNYKPGKTQTSLLKNDPAFVPPSTAGTWTALTNSPAYACGGGMLLLSDGTVLAKSYGGTALIDDEDFGTIYTRLTPDASGSYINGTWDTISPMQYDRLYYSSQVLKDGRVYVAGGEYGGGNFHGEVYDPFANRWTLTPYLGVAIKDANSEILEDGRVLQAIPSGDYLHTDIYDPATNTYSSGPSTLDQAEESAWLKLPDNSILYVDLAASADDHSTERYIPATNSWIADADIPVSLYDPYGDESGAALLLPDGRGFFLGSTGHTAYYTPSGSTANGTWTAGPDIPDGQGAPDAAAAMMINGKILCAVSPIPTDENHFPSPTSFYEFDYLANSFTQVGAPGGGTTNNIPCFVTNMLDLPDGSVLFANQSSTQYYVYTPNDVPLASGKPVINEVTLTSCATYRITGTGFNGISEGAAFGDDWQMATNYPIARLTSGSNVYYCRTTNWNSTGVMRGNALDTVTMTLPLNAPDGIYTMVLTANGIASDPVNLSIATANCLCSPPSNLQVTNITGRSATISWDTVRRATKYILSYKESSSSTWIVKNPGDNIFNLKGLSLNMSYDVKVQTKCTNRKSTFSSISFKTLGYCTIVSNTDLEYIDKVALGSINNQSGNNNGYADFTALSADLVRGSSIKISLTPGFTSDPFDEFWDVYIDYNQNGLFTDKGELVAVGDSTGTIIKRFRVKSKAKLGPTRMRIIMEYGEPLGTTCGNAGAGEAEDYTVNIVDATAGANAAEATAETLGTSSMLIMPNPVNASSATAVFNLAKQGNVSVKITDITGRVFFKQEITNLSAGRNAVTLRGLSSIPNGVYIVQAQQEGVLIGRAKIVVNR